VHLVARNGEDVPAIGRPRRAAKDAADELVGIRAVGIGDVQLRRLLDRVEGVGDPPSVERPRRLVLEDGAVRDLPGGPGPPRRTKSSAGKGPGADSLARPMNASTPQPVGNRSSVLAAGSPIEGLGSEDPAGAGDELAAGAAQPGWPGRTNTSDSSMVISSDTRKPSSCGMSIP
jgi:hypothetical protein